MLAGPIAQAGAVITFRTWWGYTGTRIELLNGMLRQFEEETGIEVKHESPAALANYLEKLVLDTVEGMQTDVVLGSSFWIADMIDAGLLQPLDGYLTRTPGSKDDVFPAIWDGVVYRGQVWALPFAGGPHRVTFQNKDMFLTRGLQTGEGVVASWDAFLSHVLRLTQDANGDGVPDVFGLDNANRIYASYWPNGVDLFNADRSDFGFLTPQAIETLSSMIDLQGRGVVGGDFAKGTAAMTLTTGPWGLLPFRETVRFDLAMNLPPQNTDTLRTLSNLDVLTLASTSRHPEAARKLIEFFLRPDIHARWAATTGLPPVRRSEVSAKYSVRGSPGTRCLNPWAGCTRRRYRGRYILTAMPFGTSCVPR